MAFTSWADIRADLQDVLADYALNGKFMVKSYTMGTFSRQISSIEEAERFYQLTFRMESLDSRTARGGIRITGGTPT